MYLGHFNTLLSRSLASARQQWALGLARRDDALRSVAETYDSALFSRAIVTVELQGACKGCPMSEMTLANGVERILKERVPGVERVVPYHEGY